MFIREVKKPSAKTGKYFKQYSLVQASRHNGKVKQKTILYLGSDPLMHDKNNRNLICQMIKAKIFPGDTLFELPQASQATQQLVEDLYQKFLAKYPNGTIGSMALPSEQQTADFQLVNIENVETDGSTSFGAENLCVQTIEKLGLKDCLRKLGFSKKTVDKALMAIIARAIFTASEHKTADILEKYSELKALLNYSYTITHKQLYAIADKLYGHKATIEPELYQNIKTMFHLKDKILIFDISNTYFETSKRDSELAKHGGNSKEKRNDCPIVVFTAVVNEQGFIKHSGIYEGTTTDGSLLKTIIEALEVYVKAEGEKLDTIVIDAGIADEGNLQYLRSKGYKYVAISRKYISDHQVDEQTQKVIELTGRGKKQVELKIIPPENEIDTFMYVESEEKRKKEESIDEKTSQAYIKALQKIQASLDKKRGIKSIAKISERLGRAKEKHKKVSGKYKISTSDDGKNISSIAWEKLPTKAQEDKTKGIYFIRTNYKTTTETQLWKIYNTIREVESTFRCLKTDLNVRPVYHQRDKRIESHIFLTILAYQLVNTIRYQLKAKGINYDWTNIVRILNSHRTQTIELESPTKTTYIRKPGRPSIAVRQIYKATKTDANVKEYSRNVVYH